MDPSLPRPFRVDIPVEEVQRMKRIIADTRLPDQPLVPGASWDYGMDLEWLKEMRDAWLGFDWRNVETRINAFPQYQVEIEGVTLHFVHEQSERADAIPLILFHGWPGTFWEFHKVIDKLVNPPTGQPAYHVVVPSLPGFGFSSAPPRQGWTMADNARVFNHLMTGVLGYSSYMAQGGDWGSWITAILGSSKYPSCKLIHLTQCHASPPLSALLTLPFWVLPTSWRQWLYARIYTETELRYFERSWAFLKNGLGYHIQQTTRPASIGYALYDSPVGILCWIGEKYPEFLDLKAAPECKEDILTTVSIYFLTRTIGTSAVPYKDNLSIYGAKSVISKPFGVSRFPQDVFIMPKNWITGWDRNMVFIRDHERGGHFPALEVPDVLVDDIQKTAAGQHQLFRKP